LSTKTGNGAMVGNLHIARGKDLTEAQDKVISSNENTLDGKTGGFRDSNHAFPEKGFHIPNSVVCY
jgi:hypothetical protein